LSVRQEALGLLLLENYQEPAMEAAHGIYEAR
jgi:hypothetical protein